MYVFSDALILHTLARYSVPECYKDDVESECENLKFDLVIRKRLNRWSQKLAWVTASILTPVQNSIPAMYCEV